MAQETGLILVVEVVPRDGDIVAGMANVKGAVVAVAKIAVVNPDVVSLVLNSDAIIIDKVMVFENEVPDDDVVAQWVAAAVLAPDSEVRTGDSRVGAYADYGLVGADVDTLS